MNCVYCVYIRYAYSSSFRKVVRAVRYAEKECGPIDTLVCNAGLAMVSTTRLALAWGGV